MHLIGSLITINKSNAFRIILLNHYSIKKPGILSFFLEFY